MKISQKDFLETEGVAKLIQEIDSIDEHYINTTSDELLKYQPFLLSLLLGDRMDRSPYELEEMMKFYFIIWEYFKNKKNIKSKKLSEKQFEKKQNKNIELLKYLDGETQDIEFENVTSIDLEKIKSKALFSGIILRINTHPAFSGMPIATKGIIMIGIKSIIECFEDIVNGKK